MLRAPLSATAIVVASALVLTGCGATAGDPSNQDLPSASERRKAERAEQKKREAKAKKAAKEDAKAASAWDPDHKAPKDFFDNPEEGSGDWIWKIEDGNYYVDLYPTTDAKIKEPGTFRFRANKDDVNFVIHTKDGSKDGTVTLQGYRNSEDAEGDYSVDYTGGSPYNWIVSPWKVGSYPMVHDSGATWGTLEVTG